MADWLNNVRFNPTAGGTTDWTYSTTVLGYQSPGLAGATGRVYRYFAISADSSQWEIGEGAYNPTGAGTFARTNVWYNSSGTGFGAGQSGAGSKINFTNPPQVAIVASKEDWINIEAVGSFTDAQKARARSNISVPQTYGQCRLIKSGSNLVLTPFNGNLLTINGQTFAVPNGGVSLAPSGLTVGQNYYIYAFMSGGTMTLEASTTGYGVSVSSGNDGTPIKSGDDTRTLVGLARIITGPAWQDSSAQRFVRSFWNRQRLGVVGALDTTSTETSGTYVEKTVSKAEFVCFADDAILAGFLGMATNSSQPFLGMQLFVDGFGVGPGLDWNISAASSRTVYNVSYPVTPSADGYHYVSFALRTVGGGTTTVATYTGMQATALVG